MKLFIKSVILTTGLVLAASSLPPLTANIHAAGPEAISNRQEDDIRIPSTPSVYRIDDHATLIGGQADPHVTIEVVANGKVISKGNTDQYGGFLFSIPVQVKGTVLEIYAVGADGKKSEPLLSTVQAQYQGWVFEYNRWVYYVDGIAKRGWFQYKSKWYFSSIFGDMQTGWIIYNGRWYYLSEITGAMRTGWVLYKNQWYFLEPSGVMHKGWLYLNHKWYYFYANGEMAANTYVGKYYFGSDGALR